MEKKKQRSQKNAPGIEEGSHSNFFLLKSKQEKKNEIFWAVKVDELCKKQNCFTRTEFYVLVLSLSIYILKKHQISRWWEVSSSFGF